MDTAAGQFLRLLLALICGVGLGIFYDGYRLFRRFTAPHRRLRPLLDILWWLLALALVFAVWLRFTWGEVRFSLLVWQGLGFALYYTYLSPHIYGLGKWLLSGSARAKKAGRAPGKSLKRVYEIVTWPFYALAFFIYKLAALLLSALRLPAFFFGYLRSLFTSPKE